MGFHESGPVGGVHGERVHGERVRVGTVKKSLPLGRVGGGPGHHHEVLGLVLSRGGLRQNEAQGREDYEKPGSRHGTGRGKSGAGGTA